MLPKIPEEGMEALKAALEKGNLIEAAAKAKEALERVDKITLKIAVTGEAGSGISSFVNAIRGIKDTDVGAAAIGFIETTANPTSYPHPRYPDVIVCDLPGINTPKFEPDKYFKQVKFSDYDFFIIISSPRVTRHNIHLAQEIQKQGKKFYFVRSKVDVDLTNEKGHYDEKGILKRSSAPVNRPRQYRERAILDTIREKCIKGLEEAKVASSRVFLVSKWDLGKYDFPTLQETLVAELPSLKRRTLLRSLTKMIKETLEKKKEQLQTEIWLKSLLSCGVAAVPLPGLSTVCDVAMLVTSLKGFCSDFGLDENSLTTLARQTNKPIAELKAVIKSPLSEEITKDLVMKLLTKCAAGAIKYSTYFFNFVPVVGSVVSAAVSLPTTKIMLQNFLDDVAADALRVLEVAMEGDVSK